MERDKEDKGGGGGRGGGGERERERERETDRQTDRETERQREREREREKARGRQADNQAWTDRQTRRTDSQWEGGGGQGGGGLTDRKRTDGQTFRQGSDRNTETDKVRQRESMGEGMVLCKFHCNFQSENDYKRSKNSLEQVNT